MPAVRINVIAPAVDCPDLVGFVDHLETGRYVATFHATAGVELADFAHAVQAAAELCDAGNVQTWEPVAGDRLRHLVFAAAMSLDVPDHVPAEWLADAGGSP